MKTINEFELTERFTKGGFTIERFTREDGFTEEADRNIHFDIRKESVPNLEGHVEIDTEGNIVEAFVEILTEDGKSYTDRDMMMFIEDVDCESFDALYKRLGHVFS